MKAIGARRACVVTAVALAAAAAFAPGCGGGDGATITELDGGSDTTTQETSTSDAPTDTAAPLDSTNDAPKDAPSGDSSDGGASDAAGDASDASTSCTPDNSACVNGASNGLCKSAVCSTCVDISDDTNCMGAYGGANSPFLCLGGACSPGDCRVNGDCSGNANGSLCGVSTPNLCGKCTSDRQCGNGTVCNTTTGACISGTNLCAGAGDNTVCPVNANDVCCGNSCIPGDCCSGNPANSFCQGKLGTGSAVCSSHFCTACGSVQNLTYLVDPVNGSDTGGNGSGIGGDGGLAANCAFKTIARALQVIGPSATSGTKISIVGPSTVSTVSGETFPIVPFQNVVITSQGGAVTIDVPAQTTATPTVGITLAAPASGVQSGNGAPITINGQNNTATIGVVATTGTTDGTFLESVTVQNFLHDGITVANNGILRIRQGVAATGNGTTGGRHSGLHVTDNGHAIINVPVSQATTVFNGNAAHGIFVQGNGFVTLTGAPNATPNGTGTVVTNGNFFAGVTVQQAAGVPLANVNVIDGLVSWANTNGNGMRLFAGSQVRLRNSTVLANGGGGVVVSANGNTVDVSKIDLGTSLAAGRNTLQASLGSNPNSLSGICLNLPFNANQVLQARGNFFSGDRDCTQANPGQVTFANNCATANRDIAVQNSFVLIDAGASTNDINVLNCTHP